MSSGNTDRQYPKFILIILPFIIPIAALWFAVILPWEKASNGDIKDQTITAIGELSTVKSYYHNVAEFNQEQVKWLPGPFRYGLKKFWIEYNGIVEVGIDLSKVVVDVPESDGKMNIHIPDPYVISCTFDEDSITIPAFDTGVFDKITAEDKAKAIDVAQSDMKEAAESDEVLMSNAKKRAQKVIEQFVTNLGEETGRQLSVNWT